MNSINWGALGQALVVLAIAGWVALAVLFITAVVAEWLREWDHELALEMDLEFERAKVLERQRRILAAADAVGGIDDPDVLRLMREAEQYGFIDESPRMAS